ncbi:DNA cytosine methyltransferase [Leptospira sp. 85282-16]|uniref:DNA cytosine methyltransferase n=1 Tax=Leptospira sp. 85282-16 TaxID=2971256 RepID=UPI0021C10E94|nr:DNA cytosine methyltransferase [Leptospira sp. 85282-16]MCT8334796.1 DNA cytosine methyltransferase [Leptospira sp. 85282-16]
MKNKPFKAIDFFCGAGGMTTGFKKAGVSVTAGIDIDFNCKDTYETNHPESKFIHADIKKLTFNEFERETKIRKKDDKMIFIGCSPCQYFSTIRTKKAKSEESRNLLTDFQRFVKEYTPGYVVIENVPGILTSKESPLNNFINFLKNNHYAIEYKLIRMEEFGIPQSRKRFLLLASRVSKYITLPKETYSPHNTVSDYIHPNLGFPKLKAGAKDFSEKLHTVANLSDTNLKRLSLTEKNGGDRLAYVNNKKLAIPSQFKNSKNFKDTYGRMKWDAPAPTITTKFFSVSNGRFAHPEQNRAISLREGAILQTFEHEYIFKGKSIQSIARQIGNAVPPKMAYAIAKQIVNS